MWMLKTLGFVLPVFWGDTWWCPLLPKAHVKIDTGKNHLFLLSLSLCLPSTKAHVKIDTVLGSPMQLPRVANPSDEEVAKYHALYIQSLTDLFDRHKERFGYGGRTLEVV